MLVISLLVAVNTKQNPIFIQRRAGLYGNPFQILKLRTINQEGRINLFSRLLRKYSVDEIPQLINILKGEMSFIGPRPLLLEYNDKYSDQHKKRLNLRPGITGLAQISGGNQLSWNDRFDMDVVYVHTVSLSVDLHILFKTLYQLFHRNATLPINPYEP